MFESLTERFEGIVGRLRGRGRLTESDVDEVLAEIRTALLEADVEFGVVRGFTQRVRDRCVGLELSSALSPGQQVIKIVNEELTGILGGETLKLTYAGRPPTVVLLAGLQGSGKTTAVAKLANWFASRDGTLYWSGPTSSARPPSSSSGCWAARWGSMSSASRPTRWLWRRRAWPRRGDSGGTSSSSTPLDGSRSTKR